MRVLAVAQHGAPLEGLADPRRPAGAVGQVGQLVGHPLRHGHVVRRGVHERLGRQPPALLEGEAARGDGREHVGVAVRRGDDRDRGVVLGGGADHRGPADVDLLDALVRARARGHGLPERVEVGDDQVERLHAELGELADVRLETAVGQDPRVHLRVQRLDPAVEALGEAGELLDPGDREAEALDQRRGAAGGDQGHPGLVQAADQVLEAGLVVDRDQRPPDRDARRAGGRCRWKPCTSPHRPMRAPRRSMRSLHSLVVDPPAPVVCAPSLVDPPDAGCRTAPLRPSIVKPSRAIRPTDVDQHLPLGDLDPLVQRLDGVVVLDRDHALGEDRPGVDAGVDDEQGRAGDLHAVRQGVGRAVHARERGRQRRVRVDRPAAEAGRGTRRRPAS